MDVRSLERELGDSAGYDVFDEILRDTHAYGGYRSRGAQGGGRFIVQGDDPAGATVGAHAVTAGDVVVADANGILFLPEDRLADIMAAAVGYREKEARQLDAMRAGRSFRSQIQFDGYLVRRNQDISYSFRQHLKDVAAAGEV